MKIEMAEVKERNFISTDQIRVLSDKVLPFPMNRKRFSDTKKSLHPKREEA
jgi:hypothetical protein